MARKRLQRKLAVLDLGFLQADHIGVFGRDQPLDQVKAGADGIDVPGDEFHARNTRRGPVRRLFGRGQQAAGRIRAGIGPDRSAERLEQGTAVFVRVVGDFGMPLHAENEAGAFRKVDRFDDSVVRSRR